MIFNDESDSFSLSKSELKLLVETAGPAGSPSGYICIDGSYSTHRIYVTDGVRKLVMYAESHSTRRINPLLISAEQLRLLMSSLVGSSLSSRGSVLINPFDRTVSSVDEFKSVIATLGFDAIGAGSWFDDVGFSLVSGSGIDYKGTAPTGILRFDARILSTAELIAARSKMKAVVVSVPGLNTGESSTVCISQRIPDGMCSFSFDVQADVPSRDWFSVNGDPRIGGLGQIASGERVKPSAQKAPARPRAPKAPSAAAPQRDLHAEMLELLGIGRYEDAAKVKTAITGVAISPEDIDLLHQLDAAGLVNESADLRAALFLE